MTAQRWWVKLGARWLARVDGVSGQLRLIFLAMTGNGIVLSTLKDYGYEEFALPFLFLSAGGLLAYTYLYAEEGVWNQVARDRRDMSANFSDPKSRINTEMTARALYAAMQARELTQTEREQIKHELNETFAEHRDGISLEGMD